MAIIVTANTREELLRHHPEAVDLADISDRWRHCAGVSSEPKETYEERQAEARRTFTLWAGHIHSGFCLRDFERNGYDDSDFIMIVWDDEKGEPFEYEFASTRGWAYPSYGSSADATPEVLAKYQAWQNQQAEAAVFAAAEREKKTPRVGKTLRVVAGVKVPVGTVGLCVRMTEGAQYGNPYGGYGHVEKNVRVGIKLDDGSVAWTAARNVEVVQEIVQIEVKPTCNRCGAEIVWLTSRRTGNRYCVNAPGHDRTDFHKCGKGEQRS